MAMSLVPGLFAAFCMPLLDFVVILNLKIFPHTWLGALATKTHDFLRVQLNHKEKIRPQTLTGRSRKQWRLWLQSLKASQREEVLDGNESEGAGRDSDERGCQDAAHKNESPAGKDSMCSASKCWQWLLWKWKMAEIYWVCPIKHMGPLWSESSANFQEWPVTHIASTVPTKMPQFHSKTPTIYHSHPLFCKCDNVRCSCLSSGK